MTPFSRSCVSHSIIVLYWNYLYLVAFLTLKSGVWVVQGHWKWRRSIDHMTFYSLDTVCIALSCTIFELFNIVTLKSMLWITQDHWKWHHLKALYDSYSHFSAHVAVSLAVYEIFRVKEWRDLENQVRGRSRSLKMAPFDRPYATFYWSAIANIALSCTIFEFFDVE